jgi:hypothetical protein
MRRLAAASILAVALLSLTGCDDKNSDAYRSAYRQAFERERERARRVAFEREFGPAFAAAEPGAYDGARTNLVRQGAFRYHRGWLFVVAAAGLLLGYGLQFQGSHLLRRAGILRDLDGLLLGQDRRFDPHYQVQIPGPAARRLQ